MKVYVAAKFSDKKRVKSCYGLLKAAGHTITHEWIHNEPSYPFHTNPAFTAQCATEDINAVLVCDVFILLTNTEPSMGASAELGAAIAAYHILKKPRIFVVGPHFDSNFCFWHPVVSRRDSIDEVLKDIEHAILVDEKFVIKNNELN